MPSLLVSPQVMPSSSMSFWATRSAPFHVAGRAQADVDHEPAARLEAEEVVEAGHAGHLGRRDLQELGHGVELRRAQVAELGLDLVQHGDQLALRLGRLRGTGR